jgi:hypothetical protein
MHGHPRWDALRIDIPDPNTRRLIRAYARAHRVFPSTAAEALITLGAHAWLKRRQGGRARNAHETPDERKARMAAVRAAKLDRTTAPRNDDRQPADTGMAAPPPIGPPVKPDRARPRRQRRTAEPRWPDVPA